MTVTTNSSLKQRSLAALLVLLLLSLNVSAEESVAVAVDPAERCRALSARLDTLKAEQDFLRFQKVVYETDSKYLVLDLASGKGMMMYRNRVLRTFAMERMGTKARVPERGIIRMTGKIDGSSKKRALIFGNGLTFYGRKANVGLKQAAYGLGTKDLAALFYALEIGANAYMK